MKIVEIGKVYEYIGLALYIHIGHKYAIITNVNDTKDELDFETETGQKFYTTTEKFIKNYREIKDEKLIKDIIEIKKDFEKINRGGE